jgi:hypothetical protein
MTKPQLQPGYSTIEPANDLAGKVSTAYPFVHFDVEARALDSYELADVAFVKIDAEGHEESVLIGARATLERCRPALVVETEDRHKPGAVEAVSELARAFGYRRMFLHGGALRDGDEFAIGTHQDPQRPADYVRNLIFLHEPDIARLRAKKRLPFSAPALC